jgi:adenylate kinase family enzyme
MGGTTPDHGKAMPAVLLIGPTGSGKTPLGDELEARGLWGRRCVHFDFGHEIRRAVREPASTNLGSDDIAFLRSVLREGRLLEDKDFPIARRIFDSFAASRRDDLDGGLLVLNGLPRHVGQAQGLADRVELVAVVRLVCPPAVTHERIRTDAGGDRAGRPDDREEAVRRRQADFETRTVPLVGYYRRLGARVIALTVADDTSAAELWQRLNAAAPGRERGQPQR